MRSENAGMSSERRGRSPSAECPRVPGEGSSAQGYSGPKPRSRDVGDGRLVDIPVPPHPRPGRIRGTKGTPSGATDPLGTRPAKGGRRRVARPRRWLSWGKCVGGSPRQIREIINPETRCRTVQGEASDPMLPRKSSSELMRCPYPKPTQVGT